ncbi:MAG: hypothetical protein RL456_1959 [Pseudomonadota bacterium]
MKAEYEVTEVLKHRRGMAQIPLVFIDEAENKDDTPR